MAKSEPVPQKVSQLSGMYQHHVEDDPVDPLGGRCPVATLSSQRIYLDETVAH